ncbi:hypothetical protein [Sporomusa acidovorans]|uniref:Uncharacterized protein n=1 Tax=Sporomusa acidovorans (strain ATCC 49682 / DSM 3132 / Mol) TaxID=1123286 RepID=A0ABZ3J5S0_SPOA4|nr:hypothetical protein [Sporomusa acidovorans]OZC23524.1 hypothetical protein SPACI_06250 [Sporomusa acidovorans DSM 3132]SDF47369.1 MFS transporter, putative metabolite transport protein [Sporomusa acidovorans]
MSKFNIEESPLTPFLKRLFLTCSGGPFIDGYLLVVIGPALVQLAPLLLLDAHWKGMARGSFPCRTFPGGCVFWRSD